MTISEWTGPAAERNRKTEIWDKSNMVVELDKELRWNGMERIKRFLLLSGMKVTPEGGGGSPGSSI